MKISQLLGGKLEIFKNRKVYSIRLSRIIIFALLFGDTFHIWIGVSFFIVIKIAIYVYTVYTVFTMNETVLRLKWGEWFLYVEIRH